MMNGAIAQNDAENGRWCDICAQNGRRVKLQYFQINYEDAILICPVKECTYPLGSKPLDNIIVKRKPEEIVNSIKRKRRKIDHNQPGKEFNPLISKNSVANCGLVCENSSLRSCALTSLTAKIIGNISQNGASSFSSMPVYNSFLSETSSYGTSSVFNSEECSYALDVTNSKVLPDFSSSLASKVKGQDSEPVAYLRDCSYNKSSSVRDEGLSSLSLPESSKTSDFSLVLTEQSEVNATSAPLGCDFKTNRLTTVPELVDPDVHCRSTASDGHLAVLSPAEMSFGQNSVNPVALDPKNQATDSANLAEQNSVIPVKQVSRDSEKSDVLNGFRMDSMDLSQQNSLIPVKQESLNPNKSGPLNLTESDASYVVKQNTLLDRAKHSTDFVNEEIECSAEKGSTQNESKSVPSKEIHLKFLQWINKDSLCWLDAVMCLLTYSKTLRLWLSEAKREGCLKPLIDSFDRSQRLFRQGLELRRCVSLCQMGRTVKLETSVGDVMVKTGGGNSSDILFGARAIATIAMDEVVGCNIEEPFDVRNIFSREDPHTVSIEKMLQEAERLHSLSKKTLSDARDSIFASLEPSLHCKKGQNDSPLMALMELLAKDPAGDNLRMHYCWTLNCSVCKATHQDSVSKEVVTFLKLPENFSISEPCFLRKCFSCNAPDQLLCIEFERLPNLFFHHFIEGIHHCDLADLDFEFRGDNYAVTGLVQYKINPDHFVSWLREPIGSSVSHSPIGRET